jgi:hypothetical protein
LSGRVPMESWDAMPVPDDNYQTNHRKQSGTQCCTGWKGTTTTVARVAGVSQ